VRTLTIRYTATRTCPNCDGRGDDGVSWRPMECKRCRGRGSLITAVEVDDSREGTMDASHYDFNERGEVFLLDFDEDEELEIIRPADPAG
jgi:hypothetical protein